MSELPASVRLALWVTVAWRGDLPLRQALGRAMPDLDHVSGDLGRLDVWHDLGERALFVALPRPGDMSRMPLSPVPAAAHATDVGECVFVPSLAGLLVPTLSQFGPEDDTGWRVDWTAYDATPVPRHRLEMLDLRQTERDLLRRVAALTEELEAVGGTPWDRDARTPTPDARSPWGIPPETPPKAVRVIALAASIGAATDAALGLNRLGSHGVDARTSNARERVLRDLSAAADDALADATNVAVMALAGWRPA